MVFFYLLQCSGYIMLFGGFIKLFLILLLLLVVVVVVVVTVVVVVLIDTRNVLLLFP